MRHFYVICPVATDPDFSDKSAILERAATASSVVPFFPLERRSHFDLNQAVQDILSADFVFADLSYERPSCYYELGLAQALGLQCFVVAGAGTPLHQLSGRNEVRLFNGLEEYETEILRALTFETVARVRTPPSAYVSAEDGQRMHSI